MALVYKVHIQGGSHNTTPFVSNTHPYRLVYCINGMHSPPNLTESYS